MDRVMGDFSPYGVVRHLRLMKTIPQELVVNILSRLPAKSIGRCRCVSKPWRRLLSEAHFIKAHLDQTKKFMDNELLMLISKDSNTMHSARIADRSSSEIVALATELGFVVSSEFWTESMPSCNGLILIADHADKRYLVNPTTKEVRELPVSPYALGPRGSFTIYGLGYDHVSDDYNVVTISYYESDNAYGADCTETFVNVYSVRSGTWKKAESSPYDHSDGHVTSGVFVDGCIYWLASNALDYTSVILGFDLTEETFHEVLPPSSLVGLNFVVDRLVVLGGCLSICPEGTRAKETDIWMMKEYGDEKSWTKFSIVDDSKESEFRPLMFVSGGRDVVTVKDEDTVGEKMVMFHLDSETFTDITIHGIDEFFVRGSFTETLVSPYPTHETRRD